MKKLFILSLTFISTQLSFSQTRFEGQVGGSNFIGFSVNTGYDLLKSNDGNNYLTPTFGLGLLAPGWDEPISIIHYGLHYQMKRFGIGTEVSGFTPSPFFGNGTHGFVDMIVYPNISYTIFRPSNWYYKFSAGTYLAYSRSYNYLSQKKGEMKFEGDVIPGIGISIGYRFLSKKSD